MMGKWLFICLVFILTACSENDAGHDSDSLTEDGNPVISENMTEDNDETEEERAGSSSAALTSYERPSERRERDDSSIISYVRDGIDPHRIQIPSLGVDAEIENVGLLENGQMDEPSGMEEVAWYESGYQPGEQGSAVLAGHVDSRTGPAVFFNLHELEEGDEIIVSDQEGNEKVFVTQRSESYDRNDAPLQDIFGYSYRSQLNLITCTGEFNTEAGTHDERLVVYTVLKDDLQSE